MKILNFLNKKAILTDLKAVDKKGVIEELSLPLSHITGIEHAEIVKILMERERLGSTGIEHGIGIPHGKIYGLKEPVILGFGLSRKGIDFESIDGKPTRIFFILITSENSTSFHLRLLARISKILQKKAFRKKLMSAVNKDEIIQLIEAEEKNLD